MLFLREKSGMVCPYVLHGRLDNAEEGLNIDNISKYNNLYTGEIVDIIYTGGKIKHIISVKKKILHYNSKKDTFLRKNFNEKI